MTIIPLTPLHFAQWQNLYADYAAFYQTPLSTAAANTVWKWILSNKLRGLAATDDSGNLCAIVHWEMILRPLHAKPLAYLHDLFVSPPHRRRGIGKQLIRAVAAAAAKEECKTLRWATAANNVVARQLYDRIAKQTSWIIYERDC